MLDQHHRLQIIKSEIEDDTKLEVSDIEFYMPKPSYTIDTLVRLEEKYPDTEFSIIMGSDNLKCFHKWKNHDQILEHFSIYVYPRFNYDVNLSHKNINIIKGFLKWRFHVIY